MSIMSGVSPGNACYIYECFSEFGAEYKFLIAYLLTYLLTYLHTNILIHTLIHFVSVCVDHPSAVSSDHNTTSWYARTVQVSHFCIHQASPSVCLSVCLSVTDN